MASLDAEIRPRGGSGLPTLAVAFSTLFWGTAWLPMRFLNERGLDATAAVLLLFSILALALSPVIYRRRAMVFRDRRSLAIAGLTGGTSMTCYYLSVTMTSVAHATLLFYLTPIWAIVVECVALKRAPQRLNLIEVALGLLGLCVILGPGLLGDSSVNIGDVLAFVAGVSFAISSLYMYNAPEPGASGFTWAWALGSTASAGLFALGFDAGCIGRAAAVPNSGTAIFAPVVAFAILMFLPMNMLTLWGARLLSPTRVSLLLMCEVAVALGSAALFANEPFGLREAIGCCLVLSGSLIGPIFSLRPSLA